MNKISSASYTAFTVIVVAAGLLLSVVFPVMMLLNTPRERTAYGKDGIVDLTEEFSQGGNFVYALKGEWEFYPGRLYTYNDLAYQDQPELHIVRFPHNWARGLPAWGMGTYRMQIKLPPNLEAVSLYSTYQYSAYRVYLNELLLAQAGRVDPFFERFRMAFLAGSGTATESFNDNDDGTCSVIIQVQNKSHAAPGLRGEIFLSGNNQIAALRAALTSINGLMMGWLTILMLYYCIVYLHNRGRQEYFDYTIVTCAAMYMLLSFSGGVLSPYSFTQNSRIFTGELCLRLDYLLPLAGAFFAGRQQFLRVLPRKSVRVVYAAAAVAAIFCLAVPLHTLTSLRPGHAALFIGLWLLPSAINITRMIQKRASGEDFFLNLVSAFWIVAAALLYLAELNPWSSVDTFILAINMHMILQLVVFLRHYRSLESSVFELNRDLEQKVKNRTKELISMTKEAEEIRKQAEAASRYKSDFLARMSHELRTPLNAIIGMTDLMRTDNFDDTQRRYFTDMAGMSHSLLELINDILDFSKIEAGHMELIPVHYNLRFLFENIASMGRFMAEAKNLTFSPMFTPYTHEVVYGDETRVRQVLTNLLTNAIKYTREGYVEFLLGESEKNGNRYIACIVHDTGIGIKEEDRGRLFGDFEQFDKSANRGIIGTGLGLAITKQLLDLMGGFITLESVYGSGSTFTAYIPLVPGDPARLESAKDEGEMVLAKEDTRVLVVDDMRVNITVAAGHLSRHGIRAEGAASGAEALQKAAALAAAGEHYDIIFMDHMMPGMDGIETTGYLRAAEAEENATRLPGEPPRVTPIIALSANVVEGARDTFLEAGMNDFVPKPMKAADLNRILDKWLPADKRLSWKEGEGLMKKILAAKAAGMGKAGAEGAGEAGQAEGAEAGGSLEEDPLYVGLSLLLGVEPETAIEHLGDLDGVRDFLKSFAQDFHGYVDETKSALAVGDWPHYTVRVHGFKGAFATIGEKRLSETARGLEAASKEGRYDDCARDTPSFLEDLADFEEKLTALLATLPGAAPAFDDAAAAPPKEADAAFLAESLKELRDAARQSASRDSAAIVSRLDAVSPPPHLAPLWKERWPEIKAFLDGFDFSQAADAAQSLLERLA